MYNKQYYYFISSLPSLRLDEEGPSYRIADFIAELSEFAPAHHLSYVRDVLCTYDHPTIIDALMGYSTPRFARRGNWSFEEIKIRLETKEYNFNDHINSFLEQYHHPKQTERLMRDQLEEELANRFYETMTQHANRFIRCYFTFDRTLRNILVALNKRKHALGHINFHGPRDTFVLHKLETSTASDFGLSGEVEYITSLIDTFTTQEIALCEKWIDQLRWNQINTINTFSYFAIDVLLGYLVQLMLVDRWRSLDEQKGKDIFDERTHVVFTPQ